MSWKKYFRSISVPNSPQLPRSVDGASTGTSSKFSSYLPEVYAGHPHRIQRYYQYDDMDRDSDINAALDTIADFCTQSEEQNDQPFKVKYTGKATETEVEILKAAMIKWTKLNDFRARLWHMFRNTIKNGDAFFLRDPETLEWLWIDHFMVELVKVDDTAGKEPDEYIIRGLDFNKQGMFGSVAADPSQYRTPMGTANIGGGRPSGGGNGTTVFSLAGANMDPRQRQLMQNQNDMLYVVDAKNVVHLSLSVGMDINWPFGQSILEPIFKTYKQKELLEDAIIIYRVQRAPERRIFYIDTGSMPPARAKAHIEQIKNEIHQRRIPTRNGMGSSTLDAAYNPLCLALTERIPLLDGRTLSLEDLIQEYQKGKENWVYSCDPITGKIVPGNVTWAGITRKDAKVIRLTLDNGETLTVTPDHKIPVLGYGYKEAKDLTPDDSLIAFNTREKNDYMLVFDHEKKEWVYSHRIVGEFFHDFQKHQEFTFLREKVGAVKTVIHHKDFDGHNNDPRNLYYMNEQDHRAYYATNDTAISVEAHEEQTVEQNRKLVSIEWLDEPIDVGTLTIDGTERWHSFHTFAISSGIFVKNSINEDFYFATSENGRGSKVETLPGGDANNNITDLSFFSKKMARGLRIPPSFLSIGDDENGGGTAFNDGKLGAALIQEYRFNKYCMRMQSLLEPVFNREFKHYLKESGLEIEDELFELRFVEPQNFTKYRQIELDSQQMSVYSQVAENKRLAERFKFKRFLNLTGEELLENETLWKEENAAKVKKATGSGPADIPSQDLSAVGVRSMGGDMGDLGGDMGDMPPDDGSMPQDGSAPPDGGMGDAGGAPPVGGPGAPPG